MQVELFQNYVAGMVTIVDEHEDDQGFKVTETPREWALTTRNSAGKEFLQASLDVLAIASVIPAKGVPLLFERGVGVVGITQLKKSFSILFNVRRSLSVGINNALKGVHAMEDAMEAGMAFVGKEAKKMYTRGGRFEGWESADGLKRFRPSAYKQKQGRFQSNFAQSTSTNVDWDKAGGSKSNMHVDTNKGFDFGKAKLPL